MSEAILKEVYERLRVRRRGKEAKIKNERYMSEKMLQKRREERMRALGEKKIIIEEAEGYLSQK